MKILFTLGILAISLSVYPFEVAPSTKALTLARITLSERQNTILVISANNQTVSGINLSKEMDFYPENPLDIFKASKDYSFFRDLLERTALIESFNNADLLPATNSHNLHIAAAGNYPEHAAETNLDPQNVFIFPKIAEIFPANNNLIIQESDLMDYEAELCATFDRDVHALSDLDDAIIGFFICNDYSERTPIIMKFDSNHPDLAGGLTDGKSGPGRYQAGSFLVVPVNHKDFIKEINLNLTLNGEVKQNQSAEKMIIGLEQLVELTLTTGTERKWYLGEEPIALIPEGHIEKGMTILMGTPEGIIFRPPTVGFKLKNAARYFLTGILGPFYEDGISDYIRKKYVKKLRRKKIFLKNNDQIITSGSYMGEIHTRIIKQ